MASRQRHRYRVQERVRQWKACPFGCTGPRKGAIYPWQLWHVSRLMLALEREREREREKFINNQIDDWRSVSTTPLVGDTAAGHSWLSIVEKESVRARERAIEQEQEEEEEEEEQEERERKERGLSRHLMWNWPCYIKSIIFFVSECWNESLRHSDSLSPSISLLPLEAEAPSWGRNDAIGVRGGKSSKCPCILCTERALLHWRHAL